MNLILGKAFWDLKLYKNVLSTFCTDSSKHPTQWCYQYQDIPSVTISFSPAFIDFSRISVLSNCHGHHLMTSFECAQPRNILYTFYYILVVRLFAVCSWTNPWMLHLQDFNIYSLNRPLVTDPSVLFHKILSQQSYIMNASRILWMLYRCKLGRDLG